MNARFFIPYIGSKYQEGINGKKILVLGQVFTALSRNANIFPNVPM